MKGMIVVLAVLALAVFGCSSGEEQEANTDVAAEAGKQLEQAHQDAGDDALDPHEEEAALNKPHPEGAYGRQITATETVSVAALLASPESYEGKTVLVEGSITEVCPMRGCWVDIADDPHGETIRVKVTDGEIVFPLSAKGRNARVEGVVEKFELDVEEARNWRAHEAEEKGEAFDPATVTGPQVIWRIQGKGAEI